MTKIEKNDTIIFNRAGISNLYIRFFDVTKDVKKRLIPTGILNYSGVNLKKYRIIPVVFIENSSLLNFDENQSNLLSDKILEKISQVSRKNFPDNTLTEIQIDCDWTESTKVSFFDLLKKIKSKNLNFIISVTIRLHQIKFKDKTGVPPADRGILMYYNMGSFKNFEEKNSILNNETGEIYLKNVSDYPLKLALGLPVFSWSVLFKQQEAKALLYNINSNSIHELSFLENKKDNFYVVKQDTVFEQKYLRYGDIIRLESCEIKDLKRAKEICKKYTDNEIIIFSYSKENSQIIKNDSLGNVYN